jgi:hypothetical protein
MKPCISRPLTGLLATSLAVILGTLVVPGCGVSLANSNYVKIWGHVTYNGRPVSNGTIVFISTDQREMNWGSGHIGMNGNYTIAAYQGGVALPPGPYNIFIRNAPQNREREREPERRGRFSLDEDQVKPQQNTQPATSNAVILPDRFNRPDTSGLVVRLDGQPQRVDVR